MSTTSFEIPDIDGRLCTACGDCVRVCPTEALSMGDFLPIVQQVLCVSCAVCEMVCPADAITMRPALW